MNKLISLLLAPAGVAFIATFLSTWAVIKFARKLKIIESPKSKQPAQLLDKPTARGGGISLFLGIFLSALLFLSPDLKLLTILLAGFITALVGTIDDRSDTNLHPYARLVMQFGVALMIVFAGIGITFITNPITGGIIDLSTPKVGFGGREIAIFPILFTLFWIPFLMNAVNWSSGVDGQLSGFVAIAAAAIALLSLKFSADIAQWPVTILAGSVAGAYLGFLPWHKYPQKIMPGFGGSTLAGLMLAVLSILSTTKVGTLLVVLGIPLSDAIFTGARRVLSGKSPFWGDREHLHHRLLALGWSKAKVAKFYWVTTLILAIIALNLNTRFKFYTIIGVVLLIGGFILWLILLSRSSKAQGRFRE